MKLAYGRMLQDGLDGQHGLPRARLAELARRFAAVQEEVRRRRGAGEYGFYDLVDQGPTVRQITTFAEGLGQAYDHVLVLGIGGSALGTKALLNALRRPAWNEWDDEGREFYPRLTVLENVDPTTVAAALDRIDPRRVLVNVISKSGGTAETMAQYLVVRAWLEEVLGDAALASPGVHHRSGAGRAPRAGAARSDRDARRAARRSAAASACSPRWACCRRRWSASTSTALLAGARRAMERASRGRSAAESGRRCTPRCIGPPTPSSAPASMCSCRTPTGSASSPSGTASSGPRAWASGWTARAAGPCRAHAGRRGRRHRPAQPGAALHGGAVRQGRHLRRGGAISVTMCRSRARDAGRLPPELAYLPGHTLGELLDAEYEATSAALAQMGRHELTLSCPSSRRTASAS